MFGNRRKSSGTSPLWTLALGALAGMGAAMLMDPQQGRTRRAKLRDQALALGRQGRELAERRSRDASHRLAGRRYEQQHADETVPDDKLADRVRAQIGKKVQHARNIHVAANGGVVVLTGLILREEVEPLLEVVNKVRGVKGVQNDLEIHDQPGSIPSLQG